MWLRRLEKFENRFGTDSYTFATVDYRHRTAQSLRGGRFHAAGQDFPARTLGRGPGPKAEGMESVTFRVIDTVTMDPAVVNAALDNVRSKLHSFGLGKLWSVDDDGERRWCWADLATMPTWEITGQNRIHVHVSCQFTRWSHWYAENPTTGSQAITASPTSWDISVSGTAGAGLFVLRLRATGASGFANNPTVKNARGSQEIAIDKDAQGADSELRITPGSNAVEYSNDDGTTYADVYDLVTLPATQGPLLELLPGTNQMTYEQDSGTPGLVAEWEFYDAYDA